MHLAPNSTSNNQYYRIWSSNTGDANDRADLNMTDPSLDGAGAGQINFTLATGGNQYVWGTQNKFVDMATWYHLVFAYDSTQASASDRLKLYINGVQQSFSSEPTLPQDTIIQFSKNGVEQWIGNSPHYSPRFFHGTMSHFHFIDGALWSA